jgi:hypothetical protein
MSNTVLQWNVAATLLSCLFASCHSSDGRCSHTLIEKYYTTLQCSCAYKLPFQVPFVPKRWRPSHPDIPQIPFTFALRVPAAAGRGRSRARNGGPGGWDGDGDGDGGRGRARRRQRKLLPSAWTTGARIAL